MTEQRTEAILMELPLDSIQSSTTNPRRHFDPAALEELKTSIVESGLQVPLLVRTLYDDTGCAVDGKYELVAGERRLRALKALDRETVSCLVREMTDAEAREIQVIENLQRADVEPLEEAEAFQHLLETLGSIAAVAAKLGKEQSYVAKCLRLTALTLHSRDALRGRLITIDHALLLARLAEAEQNAALKWALDRNAGAKMKVEEVVAARLIIRRKEGEEKSRYGGRFQHRWEPESVVRLKSWIEAESGILLSRAPWNLNCDDLLPDLVACCDCPKNTKANAPLFGDLEMGEATCTDGACFAAKTAAFVQIEMRKAGHEVAAHEPERRGGRGESPEHDGGPDDASSPPSSPSRGHDGRPKPKALVPRLSWKCSSVKPSLCPDVMQAGETANPAKLLKQGQWVEAKKGSCTHARPGIIVDWSDDGDRGYMGDSNRKLRKPGELLHVCIAVGCKAHPKAWEKPKSKSSQPERRDPEAEKRAQAERECVEKTEREIRSEILHAILSKLDAAKAVHLVADNQDEAAQWRKNLLMAMPELGGAELEAFVVFCCEFHYAIQPSVYWLMQRDGVARDRKQIFALAKAAGIDAAAVTAKHFHDEGTIAPACDRLYPKGVAWPKAVVSSPAKKAAVKKAPVKKAAVKKVQPTKSSAKKAVARKKVS